MIDAGFFIGLAGAVLCALAARRRHPGIFASALVIAACWSITWWSYGCEPIGCVPMPHVTMIESETIWVYTDGLAGGLIGGWFGRFKPWGIALVALFLVQGFFHIGHEAGQLDYPLYGNMLDAAFLGMLAVFYLVGGRYVGGFVGRGLSGLRRFCSPPPVLRPGARRS